ncbi:MAG: disulfide bond formation protein B [Phenylobacterium sp.]|uniref:disulfide bond formation protein B n=1 Tax=Phenylobacterium sp. TaxID=1871053 RepID=UPI0025EBC392|nr:disulfide bond formation protein B [Phenylobacterium sp.]MBI1198730.1 disulfide bond formation protein B [Phenylobacterium sp.]
MNLLRPFLDRWRLCAVLVSAAMLATAHAFETFGGYAPCMLCLRQREVYWVALGLGVVFMVLVRMPGGPRLRAATCWVLGLTFLVGCGIAVYHAGAEWKFWPGPQSCSGTSSVSMADMQAFLGGQKFKPPSCEVAAWRMAGISMAGYNALVSLGLAGLSVLAAIREHGKR